MKTHPGFSTAEEIANGFFLFRRYMNRRQDSGSREDGELSHDDNPTKSPKTR